MSDTTYIRITHSDSDGIRNRKTQLNRLSIESNGANDYLHVRISKEDHAKEIKRLKDLNFSIPFEVYNNDNDYFYSYILNFKHKKLIKINAYDSTYSSCAIHWITRETAIDLITSENLDKKYEIDLICSPDDGYDKVVNMTVDAINTVSL